MEFSMQIIRNLLLASIFCLYSFEIQARENFLPYEIRVGFAKNDTRGKYAHYNHEKGYNAQLEFLFDILHDKFWTYLLNPKSHVGLSINSRKGTNQFYTGLTWSLHISYFYIEPTFGIGVNDAKKKRPSRHKQALGSPVLFRESISVGCDLTPQWIGYVFIDHISNAHLGCVNPGITTVGCRIGYRL